MYPDHLPLGEDLRNAHQFAFTVISQPGPCWAGADRNRMVIAAREALDCPLCDERKSALSPFAINGTHSGDSSLDPVVVDAIHRISTDPGRLTRSWFESVTDTALSHGAYVEMVSVVTTSVIVDTLHRSLGLMLAELPDPQPGPPTREAAGDTVDEGAWVPITRASREMSDTGLPVVPNIVRALGLVPQAMALFFSTFRPHYALQDIKLALSQSQAEFVASRVSAMNECFY
jgi:hypothetical protein